MGDAGVEFYMYGDDLGQKERGLLSLKAFREFVLPEYKKLFQAAKRRGMFVVQHSCGPLLAGLNGQLNCGLAKMYPVYIGSLPDDLTQDIRFAKNSEHQWSVNAAGFLNIRIPAKKVLHKVRLFFNDGIIQDGI